VHAVFADFIGLEIQNGFGRVQIDHRHAGDGPVSHGGVTISLAEATAVSLPALQGFICVSAANQLIGPARREDELVAHATLVRKTRTLAFVYVCVHQKQREILHAQFVFEKGD